MRLVCSRRPSVGEAEEAFAKGGLGAVFSIWLMQPDGYFCLSVVPLTPKKFHDMWFKKVGNKIYSCSELPEFVKETDQYEMFWCIVGFSKKKRWKELALPSQFLFADLDIQPPHELLIPASYAWETSSDHWQALWLLPERLQGELFDQANKGMNLMACADPGTWNVNRLLRVPGSVHLKKERKALQHA